MTANDNRFIHHISKVEKSEVVAEISAQLLPQTLLLQQSREKESIISPSRLQNERNR